MELLWKQLLQVIDKMNGHCQTLIRLAENLRQAVVQEKIMEIGGLVIEQEQAMNAFRSLEAERESLVETIRRDLNLPADAMNITTLLRLVPAEWSNDYKLKLESFRLAMQRLQQANEVNTRLLKQSQQFVAWLVNYLATPEGAAPVYNASGQNTQGSYYHFVNHML